MKPKIRITALIVLFTVAPTVEAFQLTSLSALTGSDLWWHLSSGLWILQQHSLPRNGLFSQALQLPWIASSWAYDLLLGLTYKVAGLGAIPFLAMCFKIGLAVATFVLAGGARGKFWSAVGLSATAQYILAAIQPGPGYLSVLFFAMELMLLFAARRTGRLGLLWWMPLLFLAWANVHVQFVYGIVAMFWLGAVAALEKWMNPLRETTWAVPDVAQIVGASLVATLCTPYGYRPYEVFLATTFNTANRYLPEFRAPGFRQPQDYLLMLVGMAAFLVLGLRRARDPFQIGLLAGCLGLSFYSQRDIWLVALAAVAVIGEGLTPTQEPGTVTGLDRNVWRYGVIAALAAAAALVGAVVLLVASHRDRLLARAGQSYPVAACDYIREHRLARPLFNAYEWGGFLTWYLPEYPVAIDGRAELYGAEVVTEYSKVMNADARYTEYPPLAQAQTILLPKKAIMAGALSSVATFQVAYSDDVAVVLSRKEVNE